MQGNNEFNAISNTKKQIGINDLPNEMLLNIFDRLKMRDLITIGRTNKRNHQLSKHLLNEIEKKYQYNEKANQLMQITTPSHAVFTRAHAFKLAIAHNERAISFDTFMLEHFAKTSARPLPPLADLVKAAHASSIALFQLQHPATAITSALDETGLLTITSDIQITLNLIEKGEENSIYVLRKHAIANILTAPLFIFSLLSVFDINVIPASTMLLLTLALTTSMALTFAGFMEYNATRQANIEYIDVLRTSFNTLPGARSPENKYFYDWIYRMLARIDLSFLPEDHSTRRNKLADSRLQSENLRNISLILPITFFFTVSSSVIAPLIPLAIATVQRPYKNIRTLLEILIYITAFILIYMNKQLHDFTDENAAIDKPLFNATAASLGGTVAVLGTLLLEEIAIRTPALIDSVIERSTGLLARGAAQVETGFSTLRSWCPSWSQRDSDSIERDVEAGLLDHHANVPRYHTINGINSDIIPVHNQSSIPHAPF